MIWHTWLGYFGLLFGVIASGILGVSMLRSSLIGLAIGIGIVVIWNLVGPGVAVVESGQGTLRYLSYIPCLQNVRGWDILRAYMICR